MRRLNSPLVNLLIVAFVYGIYLFILLTSLGYNPSYLISLGEKFVNFSQIPKNIIVWKNYGYDGQFYYRLALNPFTTKVEEFGITLDNPAYRHQRIIYPLISWIISLGNKNFVPTILLLVNFIAILLIGFIGGYFAQSLKLHSFWGLVFIIHPGFPYTLSRDLTEILQACFLLSAIFLIKRNNFLISAIFLTLAILTKETALIIVVVLLLTFKSRYFIIPIIVYLIWQIVLFLIWGQTPVLLTNAAFGTPLLGLGSYLHSTLNLVTYSQRVGFIQLCFLLIFALTIFHSFASSRVLKFIKVVWILYFLMAIFYTSYIWVADIAFFRALTEFYIIGSVILISSKSKLKVFIFLLTTVIWFISVKHFGYLI